MIQFKKISNESPYMMFKEFYNLAKINNQKNIEAICISSYSSKKNEVSSRFVNLKFIEDKKFIFFSNYDSPKAKDFAMHKQISVAIHWETINLQIRMKAFIEKCSKKYNDNYFKKRSKSKNALAISSNQSRKVDSYEVVKKKYRKVLIENDLTRCPDNWGGYVFKPFYFEFWKGNPSRINQREIFELNNNNWIKSFLEP